MHCLRRLAAAIALAASLQAGGAPLTLLTEENPPFNYSDHGRLTGIVTELVAEAMARAKVPHTIEVLPWTRAYTRAQAERDTCLFATARLPARERLFAWVGPLASNVWVTVGRGDFAGDVRTLADLVRLRIGGVSNDAKVEYLKENGVTNIRVATEDRQNPPLLFLPPGHPDRIDLWVTGYYGARGVARAAGAPDVKRVLVVREIPLYLACNPQTSREALKALADAVDAMRSDGFIARVAAAYETRLAR